MISAIAASAAVAGVAYNIRTYEPTHRAYVGVDTTETRLDEPNEPHAVYWKVKIKNFGTVPAYHLHRDQVDTVITFAREPPVHLPDASLSNPETEHVLDPGEVMIISEEYDDRKQLNGRPNAIPLPLILTGMGANLDMYIKESYTNPLLFGAATHHFSIQLRLNLDASGPHWTVITKTSD